MTSTCLKHLRKIHKNWVICNVWGCYVACSRACHHFKSGVKNNKSDTLNPRKVWTQLFSLMNTPRPSIVSESIDHLQRSYVDGLHNNNVRILLNSVKWQIPNRLLYKYYSSIKCFTFVKERQNVNIDISSAWKALKSWEHHKNSTSDMTGIHVKFCFENWTKMDAKH